MKRVKPATATRKGRAGDTEVKRFVERLSLSLADSGVPRMSARIFAALLVADDGKLTAAEIADYLEISRAAVSMSVRLLVQTSLVTREREPGAPVDHYRVVEDGWIEMALWKEASFRHLEDDLAFGSEVIAKGSGAWRRVEDTREFFAFMRRELAGMMRRWRARRA